MSKNTKWGRRKDTNRPYPKGPVPISNRGEYDIVAPPTHQEIPTEKLSNDNADNISMEFYEEMKTNYPLVSKNDQWELYDDGAGGMVFNTRTMRGWCIGEAGIDEGRLPPQDAWYKLGLYYDTSVVPRVVW